MKDQNDYQIEGRLKQPIFSINTLQKIYAWQKLYQELHYMKS